MNKQCENLEKCKRLAETEKSHDIGIYGDKKQCQSEKCATYNLDFYESVERAFYPYGEQKRHPHQHRVRKTAYEKYKEEVVKLKKEIMNAKDFDDILRIVSFGKKGNSQEKIKYIGELTEYDIAFRIGKCYGKCPDNLYLHAGTEEGAKKAGIDTKGIGSIERKEIPLELDFLRNAPMCQIENFLCVCKCNPTEDSFKCYKELYIKNKR